MDLRLLDPRQDLDQIRSVWTSLSAASDHGYFLSWGWIETWLASLPEEVLVRLAVVSDEGLPVSAFFLGESTVIRHRVLRSRGVFLNATGIPRYDELCIEYNGMLCSPAIASRWSELLAILPDHWEEFVMPGLDASAFPGLCLNQSVDSYRVLIDKDVPSPYVDLRLVRQRGGDYLSLLHRNTRWQLRNSYRLLEARGPVRCEVAIDLHSAMAIFDDLVARHRRTWQRRGQPGAFASEYVRQFHQQLIRNRLAHGEIQLLRIAAGDTTIGCLYNFVFKGRVYFYQSGLNYDIDARLHPGLVSLAEAVTYNATTGQAIFDFLGGEALYKSRLATHAGRLVWATIQKPRLKFRVEGTLRTFKRQMHQMGCAIVRRGRS